MKINFKSLVVLSLTAISFNLLAEKASHSIEVKAFDYNSNHNQSTAAVIGIGGGLNYNVEVDDSDKIKTFYNVGTALGLASINEEYKSTLNLNLNAKTGVIFKTGENTAVGGGAKYSFDTNKAQNDHDLSVFAQVRLYGKEAKNKKDYLLIEASKSVINKEGWGFNVGAGYNL